MTTSNCNQRPTSSNLRLMLFDFFVNSVRITVRTELFQLDPVGGISTIFGGGVARNPWRSLVRVGSALGTL
ncbi:MAG: hypothetical protein Kow00121_61960 [Elainellaceae cyanobacterium]